jgi:hypothetical protein
MADWVFWNYSILFQQTRLCDWFSTARYILSIPQILIVQINAGKVWLRYGINTLYGTRLSFSTFSNSWCKQQGAKIVKAHHEIFKERYYHLLLNCYYFQSYWPFMKKILLPLQFVYFSICFCLFDLHSDSSGTPADPSCHTSVLWHMSWKSLN